jgi:hypothetical protein
MMVADAVGSATASAVAVMSVTGLLCPPDKAAHGKPSPFPLLYGHDT